MTSLRFFVDVEGFEVGEKVSLEGSEFHHIRAVVRIQEGEAVSLVNGKGWFAKGIVDAMERHRCVIRILSSEHIETPKAKLFIGLSILRPNHLDFAIEKGAEVGVDQFILFPTDKSERKDSSPSMRRRLDAIITAATKQSGRGFRPEVHEVRSLQDAFLLLPAPRLFADLQKGAIPLPRRLEEIPKDSPLSILIGPESGWSDAERALLIKEGSPVLLHPNVLRAETAVVVAAYAASQRSV
jgi:16S rRNA (uracil1498-N3)-methyltransferase